MAGEMRKMDHLDGKILELFQHDTRRTAASIGAKVGLSAAAVQRRLKRLRETGVIRAEVAVLNGVAVGASITCIVTLAARSPPSQLDRFKKQLCALPRVQQCCHVTGSDDLVLVVTSTSMEEYGQFMRAHLESSQLIHRYETLVVLDRVKVGLSLPIATD